MTTIYLEGSVNLPRVVESPLYYNRGVTKMQTRAIFRCDEILVPTRRRGGMLM